MAWYNNDFWDDKPKKQRKKAAEPEAETEDLELEVKEQPTKPEPESTPKTTPESTPKTTPESTPKTTSESTPNKEGSDFLREPQPMPEVLVKKRKRKPDGSIKPLITSDAPQETGIKETKKE